MKNDIARLLPLTANLRATQDAFRKASELREQKSRARYLAGEALSQLRRDHTKLLSRKELGEHIPDAEIKAASKAVAECEALLTNEAIAAVNEVVEDRREKLSEAMGALRAAYSPILSELRIKIATQADQLIFELQTLYSKYESLRTDDGPSLDIRMPSLGDVRRPPRAPSAAFEIDPALQEALMEHESAMRAFGRS